MREIWSYLQMAFAAISGWLGWFFGGFDGFLYALVTFVVVDYITGVMVAIIDKRLSSDIGALVEKIMVFKDAKVIFTLLDGIETECQTK